MSDKPYQPFLHGPRDTGPANPPPWPQIVVAAMGILLCVGSAFIGMKYEWIGDVYVKGPAALLCGIGLLFIVGFIGDGYDKARAAGEDMY